MKVEIAKMMTINRVSTFDSKKCATNATNILFAGINWQVTPWSNNCSKSLSNLVILRGKDVALADTSAFHDPSLFSSKNHSAASTVWSHDRVFGRREKCAVLLNNGHSSIIDCLETTVSRAWNMFASRAYLHQYTCRGLDENDFIDCFAALEQILSDYNHL